MDTQTLDALLRETFEDRRLSRAERRDLKATLTEAELDPEALQQIRARAFAIAREAAESESALMTLGWIEDVVKALYATAARPARSPSSTADVLFSPGDAPRVRIQSLIGHTRSALDICVFTITDDRIADAILSAHRRGVKTRIITDDDKAHDLGSDIKKLAKAGIAVRRDRTDAHMHHKFALFDSRILLTGSYNWTRAAARENEENVIVTDDHRLVSAFVRQFDALWDALA